MAFSTAVVSIGLLLSLASYSGSSTPLQHSILSTSTSSSIGNTSSENDSVTEVISTTTAAATSELYTTTTSTNEVTTVNATTTTSEEEITTVDATTTTSTNDVTTVNATTTTSAYEYLNETTLTFSNGETSAISSSTFTTETPSMTSHTGGNPSTTTLETTQSTTEVKTTQNINECDKKPCHIWATCNNTEGSYTCKCKTGFSGNGTVCEDINECDKKPCHIWATCNNTEGNYTCKCNTGFSGNGTVCEDINECDQKRPCHSSATCNNTEGSYTCKCKTGFNGNGIICEDINECDKNPCHIWATCNNTEGSYTCTCETGFSGNGTVCEDINECESSPCDANNSVRCVNIAQTYFCLCKLGFKGDNCTEDDNLCDENRNPCSPDANCTYNITGTHCTCKEQFKGNGTVCYQRVLIEQFQYSNVVTGDDDIVGPYDVPGGMPYNGRMYYRIYVSMNGYLTLGQRFNSKYPNIERLTSEVSIPVIAPLWADIETKSDTGGLYVNTTQYPIEMNEYFENRMTNPRFAFVATWIGAVPYPYEENKRAERADFQAVLITNGSKTEVMFNYDQEYFTWKQSPGRKVAVGFTNDDVWNLIANEDNFTNLNEITSENSSDIRGRFVKEVFNDNSNLQYEAECYSWTMSDGFDTLSEELTSADHCPCSITQAERDRRFRNTGGHKYQSRFGRGKYRGIQTCQYSSHGALMTGTPNGGYLEVVIDSLSTSDGYTKCCERTTRLCGRFYENVPSQNCSGYIPPSWSLTWGDPHLQTIDGNTYTFNGRGEYTLLEFQNFTGSEKTEIQVRTDYVNQNMTDATVFVGLAVMVEESPILELNLNRSSNSSSLFLDGISNTTFDGTNSVEINGDAFQAFDSKGDLIIVTRPGIVIKVEVSNILDITISVPREIPFNGKTKGLLGNNDGNATNDFISRNGMTFYTTTSNESTIYEFASSWRVSDTTSLFNYTINDKPFEYYNNESAKQPEFISEVQNKTQYMIDNCGKALNLSFCNNETECIIDTVATCDTAVGRRTKQSALRAKTEANILDNQPPILTSDAKQSFNLGLKQNIVWNCNSSTFFSDNDLIKDISLNISTLLDDLYIYDSVTNMFSLNVSTLPRNITDPIFIKFTATDSFNASTEYWPDIYFCGCENEQECDFSKAMENTQNLDRFYVASCNCIDDYIGDYCETKYCNCYNVTNWNTCTCGCPTGMEAVDKGGKCYDINECNNGRCEQYCNNTIGSYVCSCREGFRLNADGSCTDINECQENANLCQNTQYCYNTNGNYTCKCLPGYMENNTDCVKVNQSFAGILVFSVYASRLNGTPNEIAKALVKEIFGAPNEIMVEVIELVRYGHRKKRESDEQNNDQHSYKAAFVIHTNGQSTDAVVNMLDSYSKKHSNLHVLINGNPICLDDKASIIYTDTERGICNIPGQTDCDSISTDCVTTNGTFSCECKPGFEQLAVSNKMCKDKDECTNTSTCPNGNCTNTPGSFDCVCSPGFMFDGTECLDTCQPNPCQNDGECTHGNFEGQYICKCDSKWSGAKCETENSEISKLRTIAIAVGATVGSVCVLLLVAMFGMYRRHQKRRFPYSRRPLSTMDDFDHGLSDTNLRYHKDMPIDDGDTYDDDTTFDMPRIPRAKLRESEYNTIEDKSDLGKVDRSVAGKDNEDTRQLALDKRHSDSEKFGNSNPSFLQQSSSRKAGNHYEYF